MSSIGYALSAQEANSLGLLPFACAFPLLRKSLLLGAAGRSACVLAAVVAGGGLLLNLLELGGGDRSVGGW